MIQDLDQDHVYDDNGNPAGGTTQGIGIDIRWQDGPLGRGEDRQGPNGAFVEGVIKAAIGRLQFYQSDPLEPGKPGRFACRENALALTHLEEALHWCQHRTAAREGRGVEGTHGV